MPRDKARAPGGRGKAEEVPRRRELSAGKRPLTDTLPPGNARAGQPDSGDSQERPGWFLGHFMPPMGEPEAAEASPGPDPTVHDHAGRLRQLADPKDPSNPNNTLDPQDMYTAWLDLWSARDDVARPRREQLEEQIRSRNPAAYADKMDMFRAGRRDVLGAEYEAAADEADLCTAQLSVMNEVLEWLEARKAMGQRVTLDQVNLRALETARAKSIYVNVFMTVLLVVGPAAGWGRGTMPTTAVRAPAEAAGSAVADSATGERPPDARGPTFQAPRSTSNARGQLTNGPYTLDAAGMAPHKTGSLRLGKSQFLSGVDAERAVLDAAAYADEAGLWVGNKAKVFVENGPVGALGNTGELTSWINVYRTKTGFVHGAPGRAP